MYRTSCSRMRKTANAYISNRHKIAIYYPNFETLHNNLLSISFSCFTLQTHISSSYSPALIFCNTDSLSYLGPLGSFTPKTSNNSDGCRCLYSGSCLYIDIKQFIRHGDSQFLPGIRMYILPSCTIKSNCSISFSTFQVLSSSRH